MTPEPKPRKLRFDSPRPPNCSAKRSPKKNLNSSGISSWKGERESTFAFPSTESVTTAG